MANKNINLSFKISDTPFFVNVEVVEYDDSRIILRAKNIDDAFKTCYAYPGSKTRIVTPADKVGMLVIVFKE